MEEFTESLLPSALTNMIKNMVKNPIKAGITIFLVWQILKPYLNNKENYTEGFSLDELKKVVDTLPRNWGDCLSNSKKLKEAFPNGRIKKIHLADFAGIDGHVYFEVGNYVIDNVIHNIKDAYNLIKNAEKYKGIFDKSLYFNNLGLKEDFSTNMNDWSSTKIMNWKDDSKNNKGLPKQVSKTVTYLINAEPTKDNKTGQTNHIFTVYRNNKPLTRFFDLDEAKRSMTKMINNEG